MNHKKYIFEIGVRSNVNKYDASILLWSGICMSQ